MIFTSYYAKMKIFPDNFIPVSISRGIPKWYTGAVCQDLAPSWDILKEYKNSTAPEKEKEERYDERYKREVLGKTDCYKIAWMLEKLLPDKYQSDMKRIWEREDVHVVLLCYERSGDFCHRKLVSDWLNEKGIPCKEANTEDFEKYNIEREEEKDR